MASLVVGPFLAADRPLTSEEIGRLASAAEWGLYTTESGIGPSATPGRNDAQTIAFEIVTADCDNNQTTALAASSFGATTNQMSLNHDRAIKTQATFSLRDSSLLSPYQDYAAIWIDRSYDDGTASDHAQLGLFGIRVPPGVRTVQRAEATYTGYDLTATLARYAFTEAYNIAAASNYVTAVQDIIELSPLSRTLIEPTTQTTAAIISFPAGTTYLAACNTLLQAIGYYALSCLPDGRLFSMPTRALQYVQPYRTITDADLMGPVEIQPLDTTVTNVVIVVKDNPDSAPLTATRRNDDAASPTSTVNLGPIVRVEQRGDLADQDAVDALADRLLAEGRSFYQTAKLSLLPDPSALIPHQTIELALTGKLAILNGLWWVRTATVPLSTKATELEINRITDTINGVLI